jgi:hypothetical protein
MTYEQSDGDVAEPVGEVDSLGSRWLDSRTSSSTGLGKAQEQLTPTDLTPEQESTYGSKTI